MQTLPSDNFALLRSLVFANFQNQKPNWSPLRNHSIMKRARWITDGADGSPMNLSILCRYYFRWKHSGNGKLIFRRYDESLFSSNFSLPVWLWIFHVSEWKFGTIENGINKREGEREIVEHDMKFNERIGFLCKVFKRLSLALLARRNKTNIKTGSLLCLFTHETWRWKPPSTTSYFFVAIQQQRNYV